MVVNIDKVIDDCLEKYPNRLPDKEITPYELGILIGQQEVVKFLTELKERDELNKKGS